jgi:aspartate aminotransferase
MAKVQALRARGEDIISFAAGEPDMDTPEPVKEAAIKAIREGFTKYTPSAGIPELREAVAQKLFRENGISVQPDQVVISCGAKHAVFNALLAVCSPGDEVAILTPAWPTYREQVILAGAKPVFIPTAPEENYQPTIERLRKGLTPRTRVLILNTPTNPTGTVYTRDCLKQIAELVVSKNLVVISDEIYEKLVYDGWEHVSIASLGEEIAERTITVGGVSKSFAMTGWRIGWSASKKDWAKLMTTIQDQVTSNPSSISQKAALSALELPPEVCLKYKQEFSERRKLMLDLLSKIQDVRFSVPAGAFYFFVDVSSYLKNSLTDVELCSQLVEKNKVACVPGSAFHAESHVRLTYALGREQIQTGIQRLSEGLLSTT